MSAKRKEPSNAEFPSRSRPGLVLGKRIGWLLGMALLAWVPAVAQDGQTTSPLAAHPQARTQQERNDFKAAYALTGAAAEEAAANDFAARYPESELRRYL